MIRKSPIWLCRHAPVVVKEGVKERPPHSHSTDAGAKKSCRSRAAPLAARTRLYLLPSDATTELHCCTKAGRVAAILDMRSRAMLLTCGVGRFQRGGSRENLNGDSRGMYAAFHAACTRISSGMYAGMYAGCA